jgi:8-oxo-dGTP pyrophosphatase MutT (NUDIX family)
MQHDSGWQRRCWRYVFESPWFNLRQDELLLPSGEEITYTVVEHPDFVVIVPVLADGRVVMEHIYRHPVQRTLLECPSGRLDGETPETAARRELEEETGYRAQVLTHLGHSVSSGGRSGEEYDIFLATGLRADSTVCREPTEQMTVELIPLAELHARVLRHELEDGPSALAILLAVAVLSTGAFPVAEGEAP